MAASKSQLISSLLSLDNIDENNYRSDGPHIGGVIGPNRLFGGYIAAQVYDAVRNYKKRVNDDKLVFSMHYNFVSAGDPKKQINIKIEKVGDVYTADISHDNKKIGLAHVKVDENFLESPNFPDNIVPMLDIPSITTLIENIPGGKQRDRYSFLFDKLIFEIRPIHFVTIPAPGDYRVVYYARIQPECREQVHEEGGIVAVTALSDFFVMQSAKNAMNYSGLRMASGASLHHKIYFHKEYVEAIQWFLVESRTEIATGNKAKIFGHIFDSNKECVVSFIQEAYLLPATPDNSKL